MIRVNLRANLAFLIRVFISYDIPVPGVLSIVQFNETNEPSRPKRPEDTSSIHDAVKFTQHDAVNSIPGIPHHPRRETVQYSKTVRSASSRIRPLHELKLFKVAHFSKS